MSYTQTITTYKFSELSEEVQKRLLLNFEAEHCWDEWVIEGINEEAANLGIENFELQYSGFGSQGDGLSFTGTLARELAESIYKKNINRDGWDAGGNEGYDITFKRKSYPHYVHEKMVYAQIFPFDEDNYDYEYDDIIERVYNEWKDNLCQEWYQRLGTAYNEIIDDDNIQREYESLGPVFLEDGRILHINHS